MKKSKSKSKSKKKKKSECGFASVLGLASFFHDFIFLYI